jgi:hypothetical protein
VSPPDNFDELSSSQLRDLVLKLFSRLAELEKVIADQREEIARLKGLKGRPDIKPSGMDKGTEPAKRDKSKKRPGRGKIRPRVIVEDQTLSAAVPPRNVSTTLIQPGSQFRLDSLRSEPSQKTAQVASKNPPGDLWTTQERALTTTPQAPHQTILDSIF